MKRFEFSAGTSNKFWAIAATGKELRIQFGKIGSAGQTKLKQLASPAAAAAEMAKLIAEKTNKGYVEVGGAKSNGAAKPAAKASGVKPSELVVKAVKTKASTVHRLVLHDHKLLATGQTCMASSDGKTFRRRDNPGTSYMLAAIDGAIYTGGGPVAVTKNFGESWKEIDVPYNGYRFTIMCDSKGTWWMGCDEGVILTSKAGDKGWKKAAIKTKGKVLDIVEIDGNMLFAGASTYVWNGKAMKPVQGIKASDVITRIIELPSGTLVAHGDGGVMFRSQDRGTSWKAVKVKHGAYDLEDSAIVAGALFIVGGSGTLLRSVDDGVTFKAVAVGSTSKIWTIASWGDGAIMGGDYGELNVLAAPNDPYWRGAKDEFAPPPIEVDGNFQPLAAIDKATRETTYAKLYASALAEHEQLSAKQRGARTPDANAKLAQQIDDGSDEAMQIYADWLSDQGDPRGELAQVQLRLAGDTKNKDLKKSEKALMKTHGPALLGKLAGLDDIVTLEWRAGFIYKARIANTFERSSMHDGAKAEVDVEQVLGWLLDEPSARFMRELVIGILTYEDNDYGGAAKLLGKHYLPALRSLFIGDFHSEETELNWSSLGNLQPMYAALPSLKTLIVRSGSMTLGNIVLPNLESFSVITGGLDPKAAKAIVNAKWPGLKELNVQVGSDNYGGTATLKDLKGILDGATLPRLEKLGLTNLEFSDKLIEPLASSRILPQLDSVDFEKGTLGDESVAKLFRLQRAFAHLSSLELDENYITADGKKLLTKSKLAFDFGSQRDDGGDPSDRYCAAGE